MKINPAQRYLPKVFSLFILICFLASEFVPFSLASQSTIPKVSPMLLKIPSARELVIPRKFGTLEEQSIGQKDKPFILYIQDAHAIPQAQKSLFHLVSYFHSHYNVSVVALEGSSKKFDPSFIHAFPEKKQLRNIFGEFLKTGELSGAIVASVLAKRPGEYIGIEDASLYQEGIAAYLNALDHQNLLQQETVRLENALEGLKKQFYSHAALELDRHLKKWRREPDFLPSLLKFLESFKIFSDQKYPFLHHLLESVRLEELIGRGSMDRGLRKISTELRGRLKNKKQLQRLNRYQQGYETESIPPGEYASFLRILSRRYLHDPKLDSFWSKVAAHYDLLQQMKSQVFFQELEQCLSEIKNSIFHTEVERKLDQLDRLLYLLLQTARLELRSDEWQELARYRSSEKGLQFQEEPMRVFEKNIRTVLENQIFAPFLQFYEITEQRDKIFMQRVKALAQHSKSKAVVLVTGGYHTANLKRYFRQQGFSYAIISPYMNEVPHKSQYQDFMRGKVSWRKYFQEKSGYIDLQDAFHRAVVDRLLASPLSRLEGGTDNHLLKQWRDEVIRSFFGLGRVEESGNWTRFLDEKRMGNDRDRSAVFKEKWARNLDHFINGLRLLDQKHELTEPNIARLLSRTNPYCAVPTEIIRASLVKNLSPLRSELRSPKLAQDLTGKIKKPGAWFKRERIHKKMAVRSRAHFLANTVGVRDDRLVKLLKEERREQRDGIAQARGKTMDWDRFAKEISKELQRITGNSNATVTSGTVRYWSTGKKHSGTGKYELPYISGLMALALTRVLMPGEKGYQGVATIFGVPDLTVEELGEIFPDLKVIHEPGDWFDRTQINHEMAARMRVYFLANAVGVGNERLAELTGEKLRDGVMQAIGKTQPQLAEEITKALGEMNGEKHQPVSPGTLGYWRTGKKAGDHGEYELPTIGGWMALALAGELMPGEDRFRAIARITGIPNLTRREIGQIFPDLAEKESVGSRRPNTPVTSSEAVKKPGRWFKRSDIGANRTKANHHFIVNALKVAEAQDKSQADVSRAVGVEPATVSWWKREGTIRWKNAKLLMKYLFPGKDVFRSIAKTFGVPDLRPEEVAQLFRGVEIEGPSQPEPAINLSNEVTKPGRWFKRSDIGANRTKANHHFIVNALKVAEAQGKSQTEVSRSVGVKAATVSWWKKEGTVRWENAKLLMKYLFPGEDIFRSIAKTFGIPDLRPEEVAQLFRGVEIAGEEAAIKPTKVPPVRRINGNPARFRPPSRSDSSHAIRGNDFIASLAEYLDSKNLVFDALHLAPEVAKEIREVFLNNAVAALGGIERYRELTPEIQRKTRASIGTVRYWGTGKWDEDYTSIQIEYALPLAEFVGEKIGRRGNPYQRIAWLMGDESLRREQIENIFNVAKQQISKDGLEGSIESLDHWLQRHPPEDLATEKYLAKEAVQLSLKNARRVSKKRGITNPQIRKATKAANGTISYWWNGKNGEKEPHISLKYARRLARRVLRHKPAGDNDFTALARLMGHEAFTQAEIENIFQINRSGARKVARSELREAAPNLFQDLEKAEWDKIRVEWDKGHIGESRIRILGPILQDYFSRIVKGSPFEILELERKKMDPAILFQQPYLDGKNLESLWRFYKKEAQDRGYKTAAGLLLYEAGFRTFPGHQDLLRNLQRQYTLEWQSQDSDFNKFKEIESAIAIRGNIAPWLELFYTDQIGLYALLGGMHPDIDPGSLLGNLNKKFLDWELKEYKKEEEYTLEKLFQLEPKLGVFWGNANDDPTKLEKLRNILLTQIRLQITLQLMKEGKSRFQKKESFPLKTGEIRTPATEAIEYAIERFQDRIDRTLEPRAKPVYERLLKHYQKLKEKNYQQYVNQSYTENGVTERLDLDLFQMEGALFAEENERVLIADDMGVGKSVQALVAAQALKKPMGNQRQKVIIIASATLIENWKKEILKWLPNVAELPEDQPIPENDSRDFFALIKAGKKRSGNRVERLRYAKNHARFILINADALAKGAYPKEILEELNSWDADIKTLDEVHRFRTLGTGETEAFLQLKAKRAIHLSGTSIVNKKEDLYPVLHDIDPHTFTNFNDYRIRYRYPIGSVTLNLDMRPKVLRRRKDQVLKGRLKELHRVSYINVALSLEQMKFYQQLAIDYVMTDDPDEILRLLTDMRKVSIDLDYFLDYQNFEVEGKTEAQRKQKRLLRKQYLEELIQRMNRQGLDMRPYKDLDAYLEKSRSVRSEPSKEISLPPRLHQIVEDTVGVLTNPKTANDRIVIFSEFKYPLHLLQKVLSKRLGEDAVGLMQSEQKPSERLSLVENFNEPGSKLKVLLLTAGIGGEGLNLIGGNHFIGVEPFYTHAKQSQAIERLHRLGQKKPVFPRVYVASGTWEENMKLILERKRDLKMEVMDSDLGAMDPEETTKARIRTVLQENLKMLFLLARFQSIYSVAQRTNDWRIVQRLWNNFAAEYSANVERLAAYSIAQLIWLFWAQLVTNRSIKIGSEYKIASVPGGPDTDFRALHSLLPQILQAISSEDHPGSLKQLKLKNIDFAVRMHEEGQRVLQALGMSVDHQLYNLVEDVVPAEPKDQQDFVIASEVWQYKYKLNSHGVAQRNWMLAQLVRMTKINGHLIIWAHNKKITEDAIKFMEENFGVKKVHYGTLTLDNLPDNRRDVVTNMTFVLFEKVKEVDLTTDKLKVLRGDGFKIEERRRRSLTRQGETTQIISEASQISRKGSSANIAPFVDEGGLIQLEEPKDAVVEKTGEEKRLEELRDQFNKLVLQEFTNETMTAIRAAVGQMLVLFPAQHYVEDIYYRLILLQGKINQSEISISPQNKEDLNNLIKRLDRELDRIRRGSSRLLAKIGKREPKVKKGPKIPGPKSPKEIHPDLIKKDPLLSLFKNLGYSFFEADEDHPFYSEDLMIDEKGKFIYINSQLIRNKNLTLDEITILIKLKLYFHFDALWNTEGLQALGVTSKDRLEMAFIGIELLEREIISLKQHGIDLNLSNKVIATNPDLFFLLVQLHDLPAVSDVQPFEKSGTNALFNEFLRRYRHSKRRLPPPASLNPSVVQRLREYFTTQLKISSPAKAEISLPDEQTLLQDFLTRHFETYKDFIGDKQLLLRIVEDGENEQVSSGVAEGGELQILAELKQGLRHDTGEDPWRLYFPQLAGTYQPSDSPMASLRYSGQGNVAIVIQRRISPEDLKQGILIRGKDSDSDTLLVRQIAEKQIAVFRLDKNGELDKHTVPEKIFDLSHDSKPEAPEVAGNLIGVMIEKGGVRLQRSSPGESLIFHAQFKPLEVRSELRFITEVGAKIGRYGPREVIQAARSASYWVNSLGLPSFVRRLKQTLPEILADTGFVEKAIAGETDDEFLQSYLELEHIQREFDFTEADLRKFSQKIFDDSVEQVARAIRNKEMTSLAPVIFYTPDMKPLLGRFIAKVKEAVDAQPEQKEENFKFFVISSKKAELMDFILSLSTVRRSMVKPIAVDPTPENWEQLAKFLSRNVFGHPIFQHSFSVFAFSQTDQWLPFVPNLPRQRLVTSELPNGFGMALVPRLSLFLARTPTSFINGVTLRQAMPDFEFSVQYHADLGIRILISALRIIAEAERQLALSA